MCLFQDPDPYQDQCPQDFNMHACSMYQYFSNISPNLDLYNVELTIYHLQSNLTILYMHSSANFQTPISAVSLCLCDEVHQKYEVGFLLCLLGQIVT